MKFTDYVIFFFILFTALVTVSFFGANMTVKVNTVNTEYADKLKTSCYSAMKLTEVDTSTGNVFSSESKRDSTLNTFYETLLKNFNAENDKVEGSVVKLRVPLVILIDNDGYYLNLNVSDSLTELENPSNTSATKVTSNINSWAKAYGDYIVQFYLNNDVSVIDRNGITFEGSRRKVVNALGNQDISEIGFLAGSETDFLSEKNSVIISEINTAIESTINSQNHMGGGNTYAIQMPVIKGEDWSRMLENPTLIAFLQGDIQKIGRNNLNIYAYAGAEIAEGQKYFITRFINDQGETDVVYHVLDGNNRCDCGSISEFIFPRDLKDKDGNTIKRFQIKGYRYIRDGHPSDNILISKFYYSMSECIAAGGKEPCPRCVGQ